ncbi:UvrABC system protein A [Geodia barretti]|uniref:UvrABC system protein A n=1 Tax=Geodia barretti TaxID=519541 RepID=A0AA35W787_GEOBA|nr:UvrABC system protein A [Geodia barretti]
MPQEVIFIKGAREHNLKNVDVTIPRDRLVVITGVSGSGKSSLAFDTIYAEGQRRYVESLSAYARQFLGRMDKPDVDYIEGLSPAISIDQKGVSHNPRSTVGTVTEIYDYLRLLFARIGKPHCPKCGNPVARQTVQQIVDAILGLPESSRITLLAPKIRRKKGEHREVFEAARRGGFVRVRVNGEVMLVEDTDSLALDKQKWHYIDIVVDRLIIRGDTEPNRVTESVETALREGEGVLTVGREGEDDQVFSEQFACVACGISLPEIEPRTFSFNSPHGACSTCTGLGYQLEVDPSLVIQNRSLSLLEGAIVPWARSGAANAWYASMMEAVATENDFSPRVPVRELTDEQVNIVLYGAGNTAYEGVIPNLQRRYRDTESDHTRGEIERYMAQRACRSCEGARLRPEALGVLVCGRNIMEVTGLTIGNGRREVADVAATLTAREMVIADQILKEIDGRLHFLDSIGLDYVTMSRTARTLSGGEAQRVRLATQIGSGLTGVLYVCDEPTVGLHPHDDHRLIGTLTRLRDMGNTVIVVEHDDAMMRAADHIVDLGPGAGEHGGKIVATGNVAEVMANEASLTGAYLSGRKRIPVPEERRPGNGKSIAVTGARENNLQGIDVEFPLGLLGCVTGVSGSGKSTLVYDILYKRLAQAVAQGRDRPGDHDEITGIEHIDKVVNIDQSPIGRTPRSNPATYTGAFTPIRELFATLPEARIRGYKPGRFSFNVKGGRCEACQGEGYIQIEMQFLPDVTVPCEICQGRRYNREALEVTLRDQSIADVLAMTVETALDFFWNYSRIRSKLETLRDVGLGYIRLGQPATTLSGGEAQRVKLSTELSRRATGRTLYLLDEPTTGLSFEDCAALLRVLHRLVDHGNSVLLIEHNLDLIKNADWIIDLGPGAGNRGGNLLAFGTPETLAQVEESHTGRYLRNALGVEAQVGVAD